MEDEECNKKYDALAGTMNIEDISSNEDNQEILRRLKENDPTFTNLCICNQNQIEDEFEFCPNKFDFCPTNGEELGWLGYFLGKSTTLDKLYISSTPSPSCNAGVEDFRRGLGRNRSIRSVSFYRHGRLDGQIFHMLDLFFKNIDNNLSEIDVDRCFLGAEGSRLLSSMLRACKSLQTVILYNNVMDGQLVDIILALSMHP